MLVVFSILGTWNFFLENSLIYNIVTTKKEQRQEEEKIEKHLISFAPIPIKTADQWKN